MSTIKEIITEADHRMEQSIHAVERELGHLRAGRASTSLVDYIKVDAYGSEMPLNQLATLSTPDATTIVIAPFDKGQLNAIDKALRLSELNLTPNNDGVVLRITIPAPTEDRRKDLIKLVHKHGEEGRVAIRNVRRDANEHIKKLEKDKAVGQDEMRSALEEMDKHVDKHIAQLDGLLKDKEKEILDF
ncbi:MAG: ribosome recycling factor [bacterium]|nr:ribosome recycling factor [bacterium]